MKETIKNEIKAMKLNTAYGIAEYKISSPKVNNGCILSFMPLSTLSILKKLVDTEIKRKKELAKI